MKTKFGAIIVDGRNKIGGHVLSKNRAGSYMRTKVTPVNPRSSFQLKSRNLLTLLSQQWRSLTEAQRTAWNAAVSNYQRTDIFGDLRNPTGLALFVRLNAELKNTGGNVMLNPPLPRAVASAVIQSVTATHAANTITVGCTGGWPDDAATKIFVTAAMSPGKSFVKSEYRYLTYAALGDDNPLDISALYIARFGAIGEAGQKIFVKLVPVNSTTGQVGQASSMSTLIV